MLIVITAEENFAGETPQIRQLFEEGLQVLHVRKPSLAVQEMRAWIAGFTAAEHQKMVLHHHHALEEEFQVKGIHFTEQKQMELKNRSTAYIENFQKKQLTVSASFHHAHAAKNQSEFDYAFLSPVFTAISKKNHEGKAFRLSTVKRPVMALSGITDKNIPLTKKMGYQGVAVLGSIWHSKKPVENFKKLQKKHRYVYG